MPGLRLVDQPTDRGRPGALACTVDRAVVGMLSVGSDYDHPRRCPTHRALFEQVEDGTQGIALDFFLLLDALDREDAEVSVLATDLLLDVSAATIPPALHSIDVGELEDSNPIGQRCA